TTTYIESAAGIAEGGRTGLTALFVAIFFAACLFFWPVFSVIPTFATAPALVMVGFYMMGIVVKIDFRTFAEGFPAFLTIILIPFTYSVSNGLVFGILSYVILKLFTGRAKEISVIMYVLSAFFILKLIIT
ncbi:MAG: NCS2 family permease, partial [Defluviitaleaceae bacterium]|nr:NCS2 family permease [Defluviitaleaceae bacterium]